MSESTDPFAGPVAPGKFDGEDGVKRDRYGRYLLPDPETGKERPYTRATTFAKSISDTYTLSMWSQRMVGKGVALRPDLLAKFAATPLSDRNALNEAAEAAKETAGAKEGANLGTALHAFTEQIDRGETPTVPKPWDRDVEAYRSLFAQEGLEVLDGMIERRVVNTKFDIAGTFDRVVRTTREIVLRTPGGEIVTIPAGTILIFDLKTGRDLEYGWMEIAIQLSLYAGAPWVYDEAKDWYLLMPDVDQSYGLVCHLPVGEGKAMLYAVDLAAGRRFSALCAAVRLARKVKGLSVPLAVVDLSGEADAATVRVSSERVDTAVAVRDPLWEERIAAARTVADLSAIRRDALVAKAWSPVVEKKAIERRDAILADTAGG